MQSKLSLVLNRGIWALTRLHHRLTIQSSQFCWRVGTHSKHNGAYSCDFLNWQRSVITSRTGTTSTQQDFSRKKVWRRLQLSQECLDDLLDKLLGQRIHFTESLGIVPADVRSWSYANACAQHLFFPGYCIPLLWLYFEAFLTLDFCWMTGLNVGCSTVLFVPVGTR